MKKKKNNKIFKIIVGTIIILTLLSIGSFLLLNKNNDLNSAKKNIVIPVNTAFKDYNFYKCVVDEYNSENNTKISYGTSLSDKQISSIKTISCDYKEITDVSGIEKLTNLTYVSLYGNKITSINLRKNINLKTVSLFNNKLTDIDISKNTKLTALNVSLNQITSLNTDNNLELSILSISYNQLTTLNISKNTKLTNLYIENNKLSNLDISKNLEIKDLRVSGNQLTTIDISKNTKLTTLYIENNKLTNLDISKNLDINDLRASGNQLTSLDLSKNTKLTSLYINNNKLTILDLDKNPALSYLTAYNNNLTSLDLSKNTKLEGLDINLNKLVKIDLKNNVELTSLRVFANKLINLDLRKNTALTNLEAYNNQLTNLDLSKNTKLTKLYIGNNKLTNLDLSKNLELIYLDVSSNQLTELDISKNTKTTYFRIESNNYWKEMTVYKGQTVKVNSSVKLSNVIKENPKWGSNNTNLATIENDNVVKAKEVGGVEIKEKTSRYKATIKLNIKRIKITSDKYSINTNSMKIGIKKSNPTYQEFISNIKLEVGTYKIYKGTTEVKSGTISSGMELKIFIDGNLSDTYTITEDYLDISKLKVNETNKIITNLKLGTTVKELKEKIDTSGEIKIYGANNKELSTNDKVTTGSKLKINLSSKQVEYTLSVKGDITGSGTITISDVSRLYQYVRVKTKLDDCYIEAGKITDSNNMTITNVSKLYQYVRGNIKEL